MSFYEHAQVQTLIQLAHQNQTTVGGNPSALEIDLQRAIERELKGPLLVSPAAFPPPHHPNRIETRVHQDFGEIPANLLVH